jgi:hypothetical protein
MHHFDRVTPDEAQIGTRPHQRRNLGVPWFAESPDDMASNKPVCTSYQYVIS